MTKHLESMRVERSRIMWVTPSRIAYRGLFGQPSVRSFGAWMVYLALDEPFQISIDGGRERSELIALAPPHIPHWVSTKDRELGQLLIEAETIESARALQHLIDTPAGRMQTIARIRQGFELQVPSPENFDRQFFGQSLPGRRLDTRVALAIELINSQPAGKLTAEECAVACGLSFSRFTHLFNSSVHTTFRRFRAWKRARALMTMVRTESASLTDVALNAGYADSTHFSHSIRQIYGYTPRDIFAGSRHLAVVSQWPIRVMI